MYALLKTLENFMQRTDSIFFISGKQICGRLSLNLLSQAQVTRNEIGEYWFTISTHSLILKINKTNASEYKKKERLDNRSLKYILVCSIAE